MAMDVLSDIEKVMAQFEALLPWERREVIDAMVWKAAEYGVELPTDESDSCDDILDAYTAYEIVWEYGPNALLAEMDLSDMATYFENNKEEWEELKEMMEDDGNGNDKG